MTHEIIGSRWSSTPNAGTTASENNRTSTPASTDSVNLNHLGLNLVSSVLQASMYISKSMSPNAIRLKWQKLYSNRTARNECSSSILDFESFTREVAFGADMNTMDQLG